MIKTVTLISGGRYKTYTRFTKYIAENGNAVCAINDEIVEPSAGNDIYRKLKAEGAVVGSRREFANSNDETLTYIEGGIDKYVEYIDNGRQYFEVKSRNDRLYKLASAFREAAK